MPSGPMQSQFSAKNASGPHQSNIGSVSSLTLCAFPCFAWPSLLICLLISCSSCPEPARANITNEVAVSVGQSCPFAVQDFDPTQLWLLAEWVLTPGAASVRDSVVVEVSMAHGRMGAWTSRGRAKGSRQSAGGRSLMRCGVQE